MSGQRAALSEIERNPGLGSRHTVSTSRWCPRVKATQCLQARMKAPMRSTGSLRTNQRTQEAAAHPLCSWLAVAHRVNDVHVPLPALGLVEMGERMLQAAGTVGIELMSPPPRCCSQCACRLVFGNVWTQ